MRPVIIEVKGERDQDLPLTTAYITQVIYQANKYDDPRIALVTPAKVGEIVRQELNNQKVKIFNAADFNGLIRDLTSYIEGRESV